VRTDAGELAAATVVLATAAWTPGLLSGTVLSERRAVRSRSIQVEHLRAPGAGLLPALVDPTTGLYGRPAEDGFLLGLPTDAWDADPDADEPWDAGRAPRTSSVACRRMPWLETAEIDGGVRGCDGYTATGRGLLGPADGSEGLVLATGWSGAGFKLAPAVGARVARLVAGVDVPVDIGAGGAHRAAAAPLPACHAAGEEATVDP
jgi:glycine/D-amino acid oxidase-like deaminating enzyme